MPPDRMKNSRPSPPADQGSWSSGCFPTQAQKTTKWEACKGLADLAARDSDGLGAVRRQGGVKVGLAMRQSAFSQHVLALLREL